MVPVPVLGLTDVTAIAGSKWGAYALRSDGTVWAWGSGSSSRLGNGQTADSAVPVRVTGLTGVVAIASGWNTGYALRRDGTLMAWGFNGRGQLGNGSEVEQVPVPVRVSVTDVVAIASGVHAAYAVRADGTVWAWGVNFDSRLGNGVECTSAAKCESRVPVRVSDLTDVIQVASFDHGGYALRADGAVWAWGDNTHGALGNDDVVDHSAVPVRVIGLTGVTAVAGGWNSGYAIVSS